MKLIVLAFVFNFILNCWPKTNICTIWNIICLLYTQIYINAYMSTDYYINPINPNTVINR